MDSNHLVGYTPSPNDRGTLDLLWSCIVTIALCTWKVQRLQVVSRSSSTGLIFLRKAFWMLITLLYPEYVAWITFSQWQRSRRYRDVCGDWTMQHRFYVDMGGLQVQLEGPTSSSLRLGRFEKGIEDVQKLEEDENVRFTIRLHDLILLMKANVLPLPDIRLQDLKERSKNDTFVQVITTLQILYFVVHSLGSRLPISTLELSTLAFVCCAALVEFFWWCKPLDLRTGR